jgi:antirestriction protein ArdC
LLRPGDCPEVCDDNAACVASWPKALQDGKWLIFAAAFHARRTFDYPHTLWACAQPVADAPIDPTASG